MGGFYLVQPCKAPYQALLLDSLWSAGVAAGPAMAGFASPHHGLLSLLQLQRRSACLHYMYRFQQMNPAPVGPTPQGLESVHIIQ